MDADAVNEALWSLQRLGKLDFTDMHDVERAVENLLGPSGETWHWELYATPWNYVSAAHFVSYVIPVDAVDEEKP